MRIRRVITLSALALGLLSGTATAAPEGVQDSTIQRR